MIILQKSSLKESKWFYIDLKRKNGCKVFWDTAKEYLKV